MAPVTLYLVKISPTCRIVWLYLLQSNIDHKLVDINDVEEMEEAAGSLALTAGQMDVPILTDGDIVVFEAPAILEYLGKQYTGYANMGKSATTQATCSSIISWTNSELHRVAGYMFAYPQFLTKYRLDTDAANECLVECGIQRLTALLSKIENVYLARTQFVCGPQLTVADSFMVTTLLQSQWGGFNFSIWPKVKAWVLEVMNQPHWDTVHNAHKEFLNDVILSIE
ncbi:uncharacterized protein [Watersipora subatra]|uniref:uncharacterized protein n=1 Tax=Watersipora subatra TaxID=2589382 RepID=UPI00355BF2E7